MSVRASIVVPAYKEGANITELVTRVFAAFEKSSLGKNVEMIIVDDNSNDGTEENVEALRLKGYNVQIIVRKTERGLSSAVIRGFEAAKGKYMICMDGDLQHPPEKVPELVQQLAEGDTEFVIGTRYGKGVEIDKNWPMHRQVISKVARWMGALLTPMSDPMTGFFGIRKDVFLRGKDISPVGFKICLELHVKCNCMFTREVPFSFGVRVHGESKLTGKVIINYLTQLYQLYQYKYPGLLILLFILLILLFSFALKLLAL